MRPGLTSRRPAAQKEEEAGGGGRLDWQQKNLCLLILELRRSREEGRAVLRGEGRIRRGEEIVASASLFPLGQASCQVISCSPSSPASLHACFLILPPPYRISGPSRICRGFGRMMAAIVWGTKTLVPSCFFPSKK